MADSSGPFRALVHGKWGKQRGVLPGGWLPRGLWRTVDPLYLWSAAIGLFVALVLIEVAQVMQTGRLH